MEKKQLDAGLTVSGQLPANDIAVLADSGVKHLHCNRPDSKGIDQPNFQEIAAVAED